METLKAIARRKTTRGFKPDPISEADLSAIIQAAIEGPVGMAAYDSLHLTVVGDREVLDGISGAATRGTDREGTDIFYGAPKVIVISSKTPPVPGLEYSNAGCLAENMLLAATELGLGSVYVFGSVHGFNREPALLADIGIPKGFKPVASVAVGYATEEAAGEPKRKRNITVNRV